MGKEISAGGEIMEIDPGYHECVYDNEWKYTACALCIYRFTCKYIRYDIKPPADSGQED